MLYNLDYFFSLMEIAYKVDGGKALSNKLFNFLYYSKIDISDVDKSLFCFKCKRLNIPTVTCKVHYEKEKLHIICLSCGIHTEASIPKKMSFTRVRGYSSINSLIGN
ncbi:hypothetical protein NEFER03_0318 [Nematocida sp. LUAm3]|nr:hypothetical protein NEFER03_0318 [Nematocida sp. LUAm3]KAI5173770.1 hypothetical protein NEFER02_0286 [Nematocida sp. LUAm2]KAI5176993.1 hypothetical protein NEFER01_0318 [Nematocida sp. LUAm1]